MLPFEDHPQRERRRFPFVMLALLALNVVVFVYTLSLPPLVADAFVRTFGVVPADLLAGPGESPPLPLWPYVTPLTSLFIHGGLIHLLGNMVFLWVFGDNVEADLGHVTFLALYLVAGLVAALAHVLVFPASTLPAVGASGAIAGVLAAYLLLFPRAQVRVLLFFGPFLALGRAAALLVIFSWFVIQVFRGVDALRPGVAEAGGIAYAAHVGGFLAGLAFTGAVRLLRHQPLGNFAGRFRWSWTFRNWLLAVAVLGSLLALSALVGGRDGSLIQSVALAGAAGLALIDGLLRAAGHHALLGQGRGLGRLVAVLQVGVAVAVLAMVLT